jgi:biopolymer transport protein ExbB
MNFGDLLSQGDTVTAVVAVLLLAMSVASWVVILWKAWLLRRASRDVGRSTAAFWQSPSVDEARQKVGAFDREALVLPLIAATQVDAAGSLAASGDRSQQLTRLLRDALHLVLDKLHFGQVLLATVGSTAPFVGLLGTVWGIYHALAAVSMAGVVQIDKVAGPVGEALIMTAFGLVVAIPAVLAYNGLNRANRLTLAELDAFAHDLLAYLRDRDISGERVPGERAA